MSINWEYSGIEFVAEFHALRYGYGTAESWSKLIRRHAESEYEGKPTYISTYAFVVMIWHDVNFMPHAKCAVTGYSALKAINNLERV
jgi:hypothetical protein